MNDTYLIKYNNNNKILLSVANKCGSSTAISIAGFPLIGYFKYRKETKHIPLSNWRVCTFTSLPKKIILDYDVRVVIFRDPVERFISCYKDRILLKNKDNIRMHVADIDYFIKNYKKIINLSRDVANHSKSQYCSYGNNLELFTDIINITEIDNKFKSIIEKTSNTFDIPLFRNKTSSKAAPITLNESQINQIKSLYKEDYKMLQNYL